MDPKAQFLFYLLAFICFVIAALWEWDKPFPGKPRFLPLGLAFFTVVPMVIAWRAI